MDTYGYYTYGYIIYEYYRFYYICMYIFQNLYNFTQFSNWGPKRLIKIYKNNRNKNNQIPGCKKEWELI